MQLSVPISRLIQCSYRHQDLQQAQQQPIRLLSRHRQSPPHTDHRQRSQHAPIEQPQQLKQQPRRIRIRFHYHLEHSAQRGMIHQISHMTRRFLTEQYLA